VIHRFPAAFGSYRLAAVISCSASATVYRAQDTSHHDRVVALKVFSRALSADPAFRARFRLDAALVGALREPHVVPPPLRRDRRRALTIRVWDLAVRAAW
jgi:serine/threonine protein kinase